MMNRFLILTCCLALLNACNSENPQPTVSGTIQNATGEKIALLAYPDNIPDTIATAILADDGKFEFLAPSKPMDFYALEINPQKRIVLAFDSTDNPVITADFNIMHDDYTISGSEESENIRDFYVEGGEYEVKLDNLMQEIRTYQNQPVSSRRDSLVVQYNDLRLEYRDYLINFIEEDSSKIANLSIIRKFDPVDDIKYYRMVRNGLEEKLKGHIYLTQLSDQILIAENEIKKASFLKAGTTAPDLTLNNPEGEPVTLSSLRGKYVLIDFWASWCKPCRIENPNVVKMYDQYKDDGFEIYGVSLDQDRQRWVNAIKQDGLEWINVSDLKAWNSVAGRIYNVTAIPFTVLLDREGKVIATKLRGRSLEAKLAEIFQH